MHANNKCANQSVHQCRLVRAFVIHFKESRTHKLLMCNIIIFWPVSVAQSFILNLTWSKNQEDRGFPAANQKDRGFPVANQKTGVFRSQTKKTGVFRLQTKKTGVFRSQTKKTGVFPSQTKKTGVFQSQTKKTGGFPSASICSIPQCCINVAATP